MSRILFPVSVLLPLLLATPTGIAPQVPDLPVDEAGPIVRDASSAVERALAPFLGRDWYEEASDFVRERVGPYYDDAWAQLVHTSSQVGKIVHENTPPHGPVPPDVEEAKDDLEAFWGAVQPHIPPLVRALGEIYCEEGFDPLAQSVDIATGDVAEDPHEAIDAVSAAGQAASGFRDCVL